MPIDQSTDTLNEYLRLAERKAGSATWQRIKGFRFLLQAILDRTDFEELVSSNHFIANLRLLGKRKLAFDIGVDQHSGGIWQLESMAKAMDQAHAAVPEEDKVVFIINHLCKPDLSKSGPDFERWCQAISSMSKCSKTYMKLSGAFSELPAGFTSTQDIADHIKPWVKHVFDTFGPSRVMFGSDWPVCNLNGPKGGESWSAWKDVVEFILTDQSYSLTETDKGRIWNGTAAEAYSLS